MGISTLIKKWRLLSDSSQSAIIKIQFTCSDQAALQTLVSQLEKVGMQQDLVSNMTPTSRIFCLDSSQFGLVLKDVKTYQFGELGNMLEQLSEQCASLQDEVKSVVLTDIKADGSVNTQPSAPQQEDQNDVQLFKLTQSMRQAKKDGKAAAYNPACFKFDDVPSKSLLPDISAFLDGMQWHQKRVQNKSLDVLARFRSLSTYFIRVTKQDDKQDADGSLKLLSIFKRLIACQMLKDNIANQHFPKPMLALLKSEMNKYEVADFSAMVAECNKGIKDELLNIYKDILYTTAEKRQKEKVNFTLKTLLPLFSNECKDQDSLFCANLVKRFLKQSFDKGVSKQKVKKPSSKYTAFFLALDAATKFRVTFKRPKSAALAQHGIHKSNTSAQPSDTSSNNRRNITKSS